MVCFRIAFFAYGVGLETNEKGYPRMPPLAWRPEMRCTAASLSRRANYRRAESWLRIQARAVRVYTRLTFDLGVVRTLTVEVAGREDRTAKLPSSYSRSHTPVILKLRPFQTAPSSLYTATNIS